MDPERSSYPLTDDKRDFGAEMEPVREVSRSGLGQGRGLSSQCTDGLQQVWFAGAHSDVGGGSVPNDVHPRLANLSL